MTQDVKVIQDKLFKCIGKAIEDHQLIKHGDRILVALSGGKDSWTMLHLLERLRRKAPIQFELIVVTVHPGFANFETEMIENYLKANEFDYLIKRTKMKEVIEEKLKPGSSFCAFCARLRRGVLYNLAPALGCTKIALAHHSDDTIETLLLNQFYSGQLKAMPPKFVSDDGRNTCIRPLIYAKETDIQSFAKEKSFPIVNCNCPKLDDKDPRRKVIKKILNELEKEHPDIKSSLLNSLANVTPSHLMDKKLVKK